MKRTPVILSLCLTCGSLSAPSRSVAQTPAIDEPRVPLTAPLPHTTPPLSGELLLEEARTAYRKNDLASAEELARRYVALSPDSADGAYLLGRVLERRNFPKDSLQWFTKAAALRMPTSEDLRIVGVDYVLLNDYVDALRWLQKSVQVNPSNAESWYDLGRAHMNQGDFASAEKELSRALALHPRLVKAKNNLGLVYESQNRTADAAAAYREAIGWQAGVPDPSEQPLLNYGTLLLTQQRSNEAIPLLNQAASISPRNAKVHEQLARALEQQNQLATAEQELEVAVRLEPQNAALHYQLGQMYKRSGETEKSKEEIALSSRLYGTSSTPER